MAKCTIRSNNMYTMQMQAFGRQNPRYVTNLGKPAGICKKIQDYSWNIFLVFPVVEGKGRKSCTKGV